MPTRNRVIAFLVLTFALSSIFYVRIISQGKLHMLPTLGLMWCPGIAAIVIRLATQRDVRGTGWGMRSVKWPLFAYLLPAVLAIVVYGAVWVSGIGGFNAAGLAVKDSPVKIPLAAMILILMTIGFLSSVIFAAGEEIGWRGFLVPELAKLTTFTKTALITGAIWSVYHYPLILFADYNSKAPKWFGMIVFTWMIVASTFIHTWLRLKSASVWPSVIFHASHNLFLQEIFDPLTVNRKYTPYVTTEFGLGVAIAYTIVAVYFWRRRGEV